MVSIKPDTLLQISSDNNVVVAVISHDALKHKHIIYSIITTSESCFLSHGAVTCSILK